MWHSFLPAETIPLNAPDDWIKLNINHTAFVRVNYDQEGWQKLMELVRSSIKADEVSDQRSSLPYHLGDMVVPLG